MATKTLYNLAYSPIYDLTDEDKNLWVDDMRWTFAAADGVDTKLMGKQQLSIRRMFSVPALKALGHTDDGTKSAKAIGIEPAGPSAYLNAKGISGTAESASPITTGPSSATATAAAAMTIKYSTGYNGVQYWNKGGTNVSITSATYDISGTNDLIVTLSDGSSEIFSSYPLKLVAVVYDDKVIYIEDLGWPKTETEIHFFLATYVLDGIVLEDRMIYAINNMFGFRHDDISESIETINDDGKTNIKNMWLTYAMPMEFITKYLPSISIKMKSIYMGKTVEIESDTVKIKYDHLSFGDDYTLGISEPHLHIGNKGYKRVDNPNIDEDGSLSVPLMIPIDYIDELNMQELYELKRYGLCFITTIISKQKLKWYQTGVFRAIMIAVAIVMAAYGFPELMFSMAIGSIIGGLNLSPEMAAIVGFIIFAVTFDPTVFISGTFINQLSLIAEFANKASKIWLTYQSQELIDEYEEGVEEDKEVRKAMKEYEHNNLYIPFTDNIDNMFDAMYELVYDAFSQTTTVENMLQLPPAGAK